MRIKEIIVVEGKDDTAKIKQAVQADTIETNGSAINQSIIEQIRHAQQKRGVIIFTDPDYPGQRIRHIVSEAVPGCKHAFLTKAEARAKQNKGIGIEHASLATIRAALASVYQLREETPVDITQEDLIELGLIGGPEAKALREKVTTRLRIGYANGKQLLKRLHMFQISKQSLIDEMSVIFQEENHDL